jgi:hypothetical protein
MGCCKMSEATGGKEAAKVAEAAEAAKAARVATGETGGGAASQTFAAARAAVWVAAVVAV